MIDEACYRVVGVVRGGSGIQPARVDARDYVPAGPRKPLSEEKIAAALDAFNRYEHLGRAEAMHAALEAGQ